MLVESVQELLVHYESEMLDPSANPTEEAIEAWRKRIDLLDQAILQIMNERVRCANTIGDIKKQLDLAVYVPSREEQVIQNVLKTNRGPLPDTAVIRLFERVIDETRSIERHHYIQDENI